MSHAQTQLSAAGASFPAPLYQRWAVEFKKTNPNIEVSYQSIGSGAGVKQFISKTVDIGASDAAMNDGELAKVPGALMVPTTAGSVVLGFNLPGIEDVKISRNALRDIVMGKIKKWNDPELVKANPGVNLPDLAISFAYRSDGSGTTFVFTTYLAAMSSEFDDEVGVAKQVSWPVGVGGKGNEGVTALIKQIPGSIGYIEYGYATHNKVPMATLENKAGNYIKPTPESGSATLASIELPANMRAWAGDPAGADDYPIVSFTWMLLYPSYGAEKGPDVKKFLDYVLSPEAQALAPELGYITLPASVVEKCKAAVATIEVK
ncbi:MAG: phosphate ABC transporter substrate-binding protein PstS [Chthoniobacterales bacterium]